MHRGAMCSAIARMLMGMGLHQILDKSKTPFLRRHRYVGERTWVPVTLRPAIGISRWRRSGGRPRRSRQPWARWHGATPALRTRTTAATSCFYAHSRAGAHDFMPVPSRREKPGVGVIPELGEHPQCDAGSAMRGFVEESSKMKRE